MSDITWLRTENNEGWTAIAYDLHTHYGYKTMLCLLDSFISNFHARVERIAKAKITGQTHTVVWQKLLFNKAKALTEMQALQEECGEVAIGCKVKAFDNLQMYLTLINQSSIITYRKRVSPSRFRIKWIRLSNSSIILWNLIVKFELKE